MSYHRGFPANDGLPRPPVPRSLYLDVNKWKIDALAGRSYKAGDSRGKARLSAIGRDRESAAVVRNPRAPNVRDIAVRLLQDDVGLLEWDRYQPWFRDAAVRTAGLLPDTPTPVEVGIATSQAIAEQRLDHVAQRARQRLDHVAQRARDRIRAVAQAAACAVAYAETAP